MQHYSGTTIYNRACYSRFIGKSAVIKCHQLLSKARSINRKLLFDQEIAFRPVSNSYLLSLSLTITVITKINHSTQHQSFEDALTTEKLDIMCICTPMSFVPQVMTLSSLTHYPQEAAILSQRLYGRKFYIAPTVKYFTTWYTYKTNTPTFS